MFSEVFTVHQSSVGFGELRIGEMGYAEINVENDVADWMVISAHCPTEIEMTFHKKVRVMGYMNGTSPWTPSCGCGFLVSDEPLGYLFGAFERTKEMVLEPGRYTVIISSLEPNWKHSLLLIKEAGGKS